MSIVEQATETQKRNIQIRTGKTLEELFALISAYNLTKHGEMRDMLIRDLGLGFGDATMLVHFYKDRTTEKPPIPENPLDLLYAGKKSDLRPIHEKIMLEINKFGEFEIAPKKTYLSLRRKRQFAMVGPGTKGRIEVGLNMKGIESTERLLALPKGGMCQYKVYLSNLDEVDAELVSWLRTAYKSAI